MSRPLPRSLCLPDIVADPQTRADYVEANPPRYGPINSCPPSVNDTASSSPIPPSPTSTNSHRASVTTLSSLASPLATASTRTSLSVHNPSWGNDSNNSKRGSGLSGILSKTGIASDSKGWSFSGFIDSAMSDRPRTSWSSTFSGSKSWFGGPSATSEPSSKSSNPKEIKLSPSMIAAMAPSEDTPTSARPLSYPSTASAQRKPRIGTGLQYYTERNPAPPNIRFQISELAGTSESSLSSPSNVAPSTPMTITDGATIPSPNTVKDERACSPNYSTSTRSPITAIEGDNTLPDIRVSSG